MIADPQGTVPGTVMPRVPMPRATLELIASYLTQLEPGPVSDPVGVPPSPSPGDPAGAPAIYARSCAPCHGARGKGDGSNARFLPVRPTVHADARYMATRTDDQLFDAIAAGGYVMDRSNLMPPFGATLTHEQILGLVAYLRTLCRCVGPAWSRDGEAAQ